MLSTLVLFSLLAVVWSQDLTTTSSDGGNDIFNVDIRTNNIGRTKYEDGEVILSQNQRKPTDIFFTPFPRVDPTSTECRKSLLSGHVELVLPVKLYTSKLVRTVDAYLKERYSTLCAENGTCDISLLPMNAIRLVQKGLRTIEARQMYMVNDEWHSNTLLLKSIEFIIYTANDSACETLRSSIVEGCHLSNFELQYSLHSEKTVERQVEITTEQITGTSMFNEIRSQLPSSDTVALTGGDFKQLINEVTDKITMKVRVQEGFDSQLQDPVGLNKLLGRQLQFQQVQLKHASDQLWDSLYWTKDLTRPDRLAKAINTVFRKNSNDTDHFLYDSQAAKDFRKLGLTQHDIDRLEQLDKLLTAHSHSSSSSAGGTRQFMANAGVNGLGKVTIGGSSRQFFSQQSENNQHTSDSLHDKKTLRDYLNVINIESNNDTQYVLSRAGVEMYLSELSNHVHLVGEIILPKPINVHLIKLSTLRAATQLHSHAVLVRTRSKVHALPLRCSPKDNATNLYRWLEDKVDQLTVTVEQLTNRVAEFNNQTTEIQRTMSQQHKELENRIVTIEKSALTKNESIEEMSHQLTIKSEDSSSNVDSAPLPDILKWKSNLIIENDLRFDPSACGPNLFISDNNTNLRQNGVANAWYTCRIMNTGWTEGVHYWSIRVIDRGPNGHLKIGIVSSAFSISLSHHPGSTSDSYAFNLHNGHKYNSNAGAPFVSDLPQKNDVIGILLDLEARTLTYFKNGQILGTAFGQLPIQAPNVKYYPAVGCYQLGQWVSLIKTTN